MKTQNIVIIIGVIVSIIYKTESFRCDRIPGGIIKPRNRLQVGKYIIDIPGNPKTYTPLEKYNISLKISPNELTRSTFKSFIITLEQELTYNMLGTSLAPSTGHFEFGEDMLAKFSDHCPNTVTESNSLPKTEVLIFWVAPPPNSGCVAIKATVMESREEWFSEDGPLTKILCEESSENENVQPMILKHCCACDEAKYEVAFEGLWTRNTHPKDFPSDIWSTKFSDVIGASHKMDYAFWKYGDIASEGLKELGETGQTKTLETELKESSENIRTIIKARGLQHPNITLSTFAVFRVDNQNHLVSLASKISPSPDWIVGVSNLELCRPDCTWEESRVLNLYPWDIGTDDGPTYTAEDDPSIPQQPIRRIKSNSPNDPRSPFYDELGEEMKPLAKLHLTRQRLYEKACDENNIPPEEGGEEGNGSEENDLCASTEWSEWSPCSKSCGRGIMMRHRKYLNPLGHYNCDKTMVEQKQCFEKSKRCRQKWKENEDEEIEEKQDEVEEEEESKFGEEDEHCELTDWSEWSSCSVICGKGTRTRDKKLKNPEFASACNISPYDLQENEECEGTGEDCEIFEEEFQEDDNCPETKWTEWSPCNVTCGTGYKFRVRIPLKDYDENEFIEDGKEGNCNLEHQEVVQCYETCESEQNETPDLFGKIGSGNQRTSSEIVSQGPDGEVIDCKVTKWSMWGRCILNGKKCGRGFRTRVRHIRVHPANGGIACPKKLVKKRRCKVPCHSSPEVTGGEFDETLPSWGEARNPNEVEEQHSQQHENEETGECVMSRWSAWSPCSGICGSSAVQQRTRSILRKPPGAVCPSRLHERKCPLPLACTNKGLPML